MHSNKRFKQLVKYTNLRLAMNNLLVTLTNESTKPIKTMKTIKKVFIHNIPLK